MITFHCKIRSWNKTVTSKLVESVSQSESFGFGTILEEVTLKQAVDVAVSMELVETEVSKRKGPWYSVHTIV